MKTKTQFKTTLENKLSFFLDENLLGVCREFVMLTTRKPSTADIQKVSLDLRIKNPKEKDFFTVEYDAEGMLVIVKHGATKKSFSLCSEEAKFLRESFNSPKKFWVRVKTIA